MFKNYGFEEQNHCDDNGLLDILVLRQETEALLRVIRTDRLVLCI